MSSLVPPPPAFGQKLAASWPDPRFLAFLGQRRSTPIALIGAPGPDPSETAALLRLAARVPDHGKLFPWRFIVFAGEARDRFGAILAARRAVLNPEAGPEIIAAEHMRFLRAPLVIGVVSRRVAGTKIPEWEQELSAGAVCQTLLLAAQAMGYAGTWLTDWYAYDPDIARALGLATGDGINERIAGFIHLGTATDSPPERERPDMAKLVHHWPAA